MRVETDVRRARGRGPLRFRAVDGGSALKPFGQLRQLEISGKRLALAPAGDADDVADRLFQHDPEILSAEQVAGALMRDQRRRSDGRMAGERQFALRRENPHPRAVDRVSRLENEHGLGQVELGGDRLHARVVEAFGVKDHGKRIAGERRLGEHIQRLKRARHPQESRARSASTMRPAVGASDQYHSNQGPLRPGQETTINGLFAWGRETSFGSRSSPRMPMECSLDRVRCGGLKSVESIALAGADGSPRAERQPRLDALANSNLAAGRGRMFRAVMNRLRLGAGRGEDDAERDGPKRD